MTFGDACQANAIAHYHQTARPESRLAFGARCILSNFMTPHSVRCVGILPTFCLSDGTEDKFAVFNVHGDRTAAAHSALQDLLGQPILDTPPHDAL